MHLKRTLNANTPSQLFKTAVSECFLTLWHTRMTAQTVPSASSGGPSSNARHRLRKMRHRCYGVASGKSPHQPRAVATYFHSSHTTTTRKNKLLSPPLHGASSAVKHPQTAINSGFASSRSNKGDSAHAIHC